MRLFGLSPLAWALGALALLLVLGVLHLLRVRLRRVEVDTLLFFQLAGVVRQPRVLPGRPARLLAFLLAAAALLLAWTAFADPRRSADAPSRIVLVEPAPGPERTARLAAAAELSAQGLGPRGAVLVADSSCAVLRAADEPDAALALRAAALPEHSSVWGVATALRAAADRLRPGDELVHVGATPPALALPRAELRVAARSAPPAPWLQSLRWIAAPEAAASAGAATAGGSSRLVVDLLPGGPGRAVLRAGGQELDAAELPAQADSVQVALGPVPRATAGLELALAVTGQAERSVAVPAPGAAPVRVHVAEDVPPDAARAARTVLALDPELVLVPEPAEAEVLVVGAEADDRRPCLVVSPGEGGGPRLALARPDCPVSVSLRDRTRRDAPALAAPAGATVWIEDVSQGAPLACASRAGSRLRVHLVSWLLQPVTHADTPALLLGSVRLLAGRPAALLGLPGQGLVRPAAWAEAEARLGTTSYLPEGGSYRIPADPHAAPTLATAAGPVQVQVLTVPGSGGEAALPLPDLAALGGAGRLLPWLVALLLLTFLCDAVLFHRGRLP